MAGEIFSYSDIAGNRKCFFIAGFSCKHNLCCLRIKIPHTGQIYPNSRFDRKHIDKFNDIIIGFAVMNNGNAYSFTNYFPFVGKLHGAADVAVSRMLTE